MSKIFISYRRDDTLSDARELYDRLEDHFGHDSVIWDIDKIPLGADFRRFVVDCLAEVAVVLVLIGRGWLSAEDEDGRRKLNDPDDLLRIEVEVALARGVATIPVLIGKTEMPRARDLPETIRLLPTLNAISLDQGRDFHLHVNRLISRLEKEVGLTPVTKPASHRTADVVELARWDAIKNSSDPVDFRDFISRFPAGHMSDLAEKRLRSLEEQEWEVVSSAPSISDLEGFVERFEDGPFTERARAQLNTLKGKQVVAARARQEWEKIRQLETASEFRKFAQNYPGTAQAGLAQKRAEELDALEKDRARAQIAMEASRRHEEANQEQAQKEEKARKKEEKAREREQEYEKGKQSAFNIMLGTFVLVWCGMVLIAIITPRAGILQWLENVIAWILFGWVYAGIAALLLGGLAYLAALSKKGNN